MTSALGCSSPVSAQESQSPTAQDVTMSNYFLNNGPSGCTKTTGDPSSCSDPCSHSSCPGYSAQACANYEEEEEVGEPETSDPGSCIIWWNVTTYYSCSGGTCTYLGETWDYLYTDCSADPCGGQCTCGAECMPSGECGPPTIECSPIIIAVGDNSAYRLTSADQGVLFDMNGDGIRERMSWTHAGDPIAFLVLDRNGNGNIDDGTELFGNHSALPSGQPAINGFEALAYYDQNQGNGDGMIDSQDGVWSSLRLWIDWNHDALTQSGELYTLEQWQLSSISLQYRTTNRTDQYGNVFRLKAPCELGGTARSGYDVYFNLKPQMRRNHRRTR